MLGEEKLHEIWDGISKARNEHTESAFPEDFWDLIPGIQGKDEFVRPKSQTQSQIHNDLFQELTYTPFKGTSRADLAAWRSCR